MIDSLLANRFKVSSSDFKLLQLHVFSLLNDVWLAVIKFFQFLFCFVFSKVNWTPKVSKDLIKQGILPDVKVNTAVIMLLQYCYLNNSNVNINQTDALPYIC